MKFINFLIVLPKKAVVDEDGEKAPLGTLFKNDIQKIFQSIYQQNKD